MENENNDNVNKYDLAHFEEALVEIVYTQIALLDKLKKEREISIRSYCYLVSCLIEKSRKHLVNQSKLKYLQETTNQNKAEMIEKAIRIKDEDSYDDIIIN